MCPEGKSWVNVKLPEDVKGGQISVGPTGMVWLVTWQGTLYLRTGISKFQLWGNKQRPMSALEIAFVDKMECQGGGLTP